MTELAEQKLKVEVEDTGEIWEDKIQTYRLTSNYLTPADQFSFTVYNDDDPASLRRSFQPLMRVKLYIDGDLQIIGMIDSTEGVGESSSVLSVEGRCYMAELVDASADPSVVFTEKQDLGDALLALWRPWVETLLGHWNLTRNLLTGRAPTAIQPKRDFINAKLSEFTIRAGDGAYQAGDKIVSRHGFTIQQGGKRGTVCIVEPQYGQDPSYDLIRGENVMTGSARRDYADAPTVTIATGRVKKVKKTKDAALFAKTAGLKDGRANNEQLVPSLVQFPTFGELAPNELGKLDEVKRITLEPVTKLRQARVDWKKKTPPFKPEDNTLYRPMYYEDTHSRTDEEVERGVRRELSRRLKSCLTYKCKVRGHRDLKSGAIYTCDTMANVKDPVEDVNQAMWILERTLYNDGHGPLTDLQLILPGAIAL